MTTKPQSTKHDKYPAAWLYLIGGFLFSALLAWRMYTFQDFYSMIVPQNSLWIGLFGLVGTIALLVIWESGRLSEKKLFWTFALLVSVLPVVITVRQIVDHQTNTNITPYEVDSGVQTEVAAGMMAAGKNPYAEDFSQTPYGGFQGPYYTRQNTLGNIAWQHYAYPPLTFLVAVPLRVITNRLHLVYDTRMAVLPFYFLGGAVLAAAMSTWRQRAVALLLTIGNPLWMFYLAAGFNDAQYVSMIVIAAIALFGRRFGWSAVAIGLACALKQLAWPLAGLWAIFVFRKAGATRWKTLGIFAGLTALIYTPFLIWNAGAMYDDIIRYVSGMQYGAYAISGLTFLQYLRVWGIIRDPWTIVPAWILQLAVGLPIFLWGAWAMWRRASSAAWLVFGGLFVLGVGIVARYQYDNYIASVMICILCAACLHHQETSRE